PATWVQFPSPQPISNEAKTHFENDASNRPTGARRFCKGRVCQWPRHHSRLVSAAQPRKWQRVFPDYRWKAIAVSCAPKKITIELMSVDNKRVLQRAVFALDKGQRFAQGGIEKILAKFSDDVVARFPGLSYRIVPMFGHRYRFVHRPK